MKTQGNVKFILLRNIFQDIMKKKKKNYNETAIKR